MINVEDRRLSMYGGVCSVTLSLIYYTSECFPLDERTLTRGEDGTTVDSLIFLTRKMRPRLRQLGFCQGIP